jgi:hypothetical protein
VSVCICTRTRSVDYLSVECVTPALVLAIVFTSMDVSDAVHLDVTRNDRGWEKK